MPIERFVKNVLTCDVCQKQLEIAGEVENRHPWMPIEHREINEPDIVLCSKVCVKKYLEQQAAIKVETQFAELYGREQADQAS